uniref:Zinc finger and BTB domain-containing protein 44 n=1 Tax=Cyprinus carpio carpio TaxID=630221 RepID=A0A8C0YP22_CYPCA
MGVKTFTHNSPNHSQELLDKLNTLRSEGHFCDVTIRVQGQMFSAHKVVLACCSDFLRAKLSGKPAEEDTVIVGEDNKHVLDLQHVTVAGFAPLLEYAYTSTLSISTENIIDVLAAASYMQMFAVANTCSEFMKSSILWNSASSGAGGPGSTQPPVLHRPQETPEGNTSCTLAPVDALSPSPVSSECSVPERPIPVCRESRRKRKGFASPQPASSTSPQVPNPSPSSSSFPESSAQALEPSLAFSWTYPFGVDRRFAAEKSKLPEGLLEPSGAPGQDSSGRALVEYLACEGPRSLGVVGAAGVVEEEEEEDVQVKVERLSDEEVHEEVSQPVSAPHSSLSDQQTVPGNDHTQEDLLISPQSSSIGSLDEGVTEGLQSMQGTPNTTGHMEEDERLENVQYPYHLYISPSTRPGLNGPERPFQCPTCGVRFTRIQNLKQHMLIHSVYTEMAFCLLLITSMSYGLVKVIVCNWFRCIKPFQCDRCGKKFTRAYSLKMHRLKHEGKRCFRCQICSATFTSFGEYKHHMRVSRHIIRKPRIYECKTCGAMFTNSGNLIVHLRSLNHEASELANYFQTSEFLLPDYLSHMQEEEGLGHFEMSEQTFFLLFLSPNTSYLSSFLYHEL